MLAYEEPSISAAQMVIGKDPNGGNVPIQRVIGVG